VFPKRIRELSRRKFTPKGASIGLVRLPDITGTRT
jgi:hypothetical protein